MAQNTPGKLRISIDSGAKRTFLSICGSGLVHTSQETPIDTVVDETRVSRLTASSGEGEVEGTHER